MELNVELKPKNNISHSIGDRISVQKVEYHNDLKNLEYEKSGHKGFQKEITEKNKLPSNLIDGIPTKLSELEQDIELGKIDDVKVDGVSVVTNKIANINIFNKQDKLIEGNNVEIVGNKISVLTTDSVSGDLTRPITASGVNTIVGNIDSILKLL